MNANNLTSKKRVALGVVAAAVTALTLSGCSSLFPIAAGDTASTSTPAPRPTVDSVTPSQADIPNEYDLGVEKVALPDGRHVTCIFTHVNGGYSTSCDWAGAK